MMNIKRYIGCLAVMSMMLSACTSDEPVGGGSTVETGKGVRTYINVNLAMGDEQSRADDGGFEEASSWQANIRSARFFFFDQSGDFLQEGTVWNGTGSSNTEDKANVEFFGNTVVVLEDVVTKPTYVVVVVNGTDTMSTPTSLSNMNSMMGSAVATSGMRGIYTYINKTYYPVMSSSSYCNNEAYPFVTKVDPSYFKSSAEEAADEDALTIYVERLMAGVYVDTDELQKNKECTVNSNGCVLVKVDDLKINGWPEGEDVYVLLYGVYTNCVTSDTYLMKHIDTAWTASSLGFNWDASALYHRTYWGKSYNYGDESCSYPDRYTPGMSSTLIYNAFASSSGTISRQKFDYLFGLAENTNTSDIVSAHFPSAVSSVMVKAGIVHKNDTYTGFEAAAGETVIKYDGQYYTKSNFLKMLATYVMERAGAYYWVSDGTYYIVTDNGEALFDIVTDTDKYNGAVKLALSDKSSNGDFYTFNKDVIKLSTVQAAIDRFNAGFKGMIGYRYGYMYYNVPIEHFNNSEVSSSGVIPEAKYGVVRNHLYKISITNLNGAGKGVWVYDEPIVPNDDEETGDNTKALEFRVRIVSWKHVSQHNTL